MASNPRSAAWRAIPACLAWALASLASPAPAGAEGAAPRVVLWAPPGAGAPGDADLRRLEALGVVVDPPPAPDEPSPEARGAHDEASAVLEHAQARYYEARFDEAARLLEDLVTVRGAALAALGGAEALRGPVLWLGVSLAKLGRGDEAAGWFALALGLGQTEIDRALFPPEVTAVFDRARQAAAGPGTTATFSSEPAGARFEVDGAAVGPTASLGPGRHVVIARRLGSAPAAALIAVGADALSTTLRLEPASRDEAARQVAALRSAGELSPSDSDHLALLALASGADLVAVVDRAGGAVRLYDAAGEPASWPETAEPAAAPLATTAEPGPDEPPPPERRPVWRRWWFWVALVGGAAAVATGVGVGVRYGGDDTFTIVPGQRRSEEP